jgi:hypothetical protein
MSNICDQAAQALWVAQHYETIARRDADNVLVQRIKDQAWSQYFLLSGIRDHPSNIR